MARIARADAGIPDGGEPDVGAGAFAPLRDRVLGELLGDDPATARDLGLHEYDGKVAGVSKEALAARVARLRRAAAELAAVSPSALSADEALDLAELRSWVASGLFTLVDTQAPATRPGFYESLFALSAYIDRDYAPLEARQARLVAHEEAALAEVAHVRENLAPPLVQADHRGRRAQLRGVRDLPSRRRRARDGPRRRRRAKAAVRERRTRRSPRRPRSSRRG